MCESPMDRDAPVMLAWNTFKATEAYENAARWAVSPEDTAGSLWCAFLEGYSRARETEDGASSTLVPERPGDSPSRCGLAFGQCRYQRRAAAESCALLSTPTPGLDMTQVLFPGSRPKPKPQTEDGAVREAAEKLGRELSMHIATTPVHVVAAIQALLDAAKGGPDAR